MLETKPGFVANLDAEGSSVLIQPESVVKFQGTFLSLEHGSVAVGTSTSMSVHVNCIKVEPVSSERTQYDVADVSGTVQVAAHKNDVNITVGGVAKGIFAKNNPSGQSALSSVVHEGQQATREEAAACGAAARPASTGNGMNTKWLEIGGGVGVGVLVLCLLLCRGSEPSSVSPSQPSELVLPVRASQLPSMRSRHRLVRQPAGSDRCAHLFSVCTIPLGQRISTNCAVISDPKPKCTRLSLDER